MTYFLSLLDDRLQRQKLPTELLVFEQVKALHETVLLHILPRNVFFKALKNGNRESDGSKVAFDNNEVQKVLDVAEREGVDEESEKPLEQPKLVWQICVF
jgi:hypothetical protein